MIRTDLDAAGVPVEVDGPEGTETRDFHALRAVFISNVIRAGADLKQAMTLARHSDPRLTASRYARTRLHDLGAVVDKLPEAGTPSPDPAVLRMTGTDRGAAAGGEMRLRLRTNEEFSQKNNSDGATQKPLKSQGLEENREPLREIGKEASPGFEPGDNGFANRNWIDVSGSQKKPCGSEIKMFAACFH